MRKLFVASSILSGAIVVACLLYSHWHMSGINASLESGALLRESNVPQASLPDHRVIETETTPPAISTDSVAHKSVHNYMELYESGQIDLDTAIEMATERVSQLKAEVASFGSLEKYRALADTDRPVGDFVTEANALFRRHGIDVTIREGDY